MKKDEEIHHIQMYASSIKVCLLVTWKRQVAQTKSTKDTYYVSLQEGTWSGNSRWSRVPLQKLQSRARDDPDRRIQKLPTVKMPKPETKSLNWDFS